MLSSAQTRATHYRQQAAKLRGMAENQTDDGVRRDLLDLAVKYNALANSVLTRPDSDPDRIDAAQAWLAIPALEHALALWIDDGDDVGDGDLPNRQLQGQQHGRWAVYATCRCA
jgi:hypothetical protein